MAAKRIATTSINWSELAQRTPAQQKGLFVQFKGRTDKYLQAIAANPEQSPKIDWSFYKSRIATAGIADSFQKAYESLTIPYPTDKVSGEVDQLRVESQKSIATFKAESEQRIADHEKDIARYKAIMPYNQMTMEDFYEAHPEHSIYDHPNGPSLWPHDEESQPGYVDPKENEEQH